jgi:hypothetical protein
LLIRRGLGKENIATARKAEPSELNQFTNSFPVACEKQETVTQGTAVMLKRFSGIQMPRARTAYAGANNAMQS